MRKAEGLALAAIATFAAFAGCLDGDGDAEGALAEGNLTVAEDAPRAADGTPLHVARFGTGTLVDASRWANGSFTPDQASRAADALPGVAPTEPTGIVQVDVSDLLPPGVPARVFAEVTAELAHGDLDLFLQAPDGQWRTGNFDAPYGGVSRFEVGLVHTSGDPVVVTLVYDALEPAAEVPYTLGIRVVSDPELLLNGIVAGVTLPADARFDVELLGAVREVGPEIEEVGLMVYAPDDTFVGRFALQGGATSITLPEGSPAGEYAMLLSQGGRNARILVQGAPATMRALPIEWVNGEMVELDAQGRGSWTTDFPDTPLLVGIFFTSPNVAHNVAFTVDSPTGPLFSGSDSSDVPWFAVSTPASSYQNGWGWDSLWGPAGLAAGTHTAEVTFEAGAGAQPAVGQLYAAFFSR